MQFWRHKSTARRKTQAQNFLVCDQIDKKESLKAKFDGLIRVGGQPVGNQK